MGQLFKSLLKIREGVCTPGVPNFLGKIQIKTRIY